MNKSVEIFKELVNKLKDQNDSEKELFEELSKVIDKYEKNINYRANLSDKDLIRMFFADDDFDPQNITISEDLKPFDVVNMGYYNEKTNSFESYPFKVINVEDGKIELLGLKLLGYGHWDDIKDMKFKFIYDKPDTDYFVAHGEIPDKDRLVEIRDNYPERGLFDKDNYDLIAIGSWYWTKTKYEGYGSNAWYVGSNGHVIYGSTSSSLGALPYVVIDL